MNKKNTILIASLLLFTLLVLAIIKGKSYELGKTVISEKCSAEIEGLKLCTENSKLILNSGEAIKIKVFWINSTDTDRQIIRSDYNVKVLDENGVKLIPALQEKIRNNLMTHVTQESRK